MFKTRFLCLILGICSQYDAYKPGLVTKVQWSQLEYDYPSSTDRNSDIENGNFIPGKPTPIDVDAYYSSKPTDSKLFITIPRYPPGVPCTLGTVTNKLFKGNPVIAPYPDWSWHKNPRKCNSNRIVSVFRIMVDECDRLWVLDTGKIIEEQICRPQILAFDLKTNKLLHKYEIPSNQTEERSLFVTPVVEVLDPRSQCKDTYVYMADCATFSLVVYSLKSGISWRITDKTMYPYPNFGTYSIKGDTFDLMDGILGMSLSPIIPGKERKLFYHAMSSGTENWVYTSFLRNQSSTPIFNTYRLERDTQSAAEAIDSNGIMYFGLMSSIKIACCNTKWEYADPNSCSIIAENQQTLQFPSGMKLPSNLQGKEQLLVLTSRFQKLAAGTMNASETNFRILSGIVQDLVAQTACQKRR